MTGELIRRARDIQGLTQVEFAKLMGFTNAFLNQIEKGKVAIPAKYIEKAARILKIEKDDILKAVKKDFSERLEQRARDGR